MIFLLNKSVSKIVLVTSVLFICVCDCGDYPSWDLGYENSIISWFTNRTLSKTTTTTPSTTIKTTTSTNTDTPTTDQQLTTMDDQYGKPNSNEGMFQFLLPTPLKLGDKMRVSGTLRENAKTVSLSLVTGYNGADLSNIGLQFNATMEEEGGTDTYHISRTIDGITEASPVVQHVGKLFIDSKFYFEIKFDTVLNSEENYLFVFENRGTVLDVNGTLSNELKHRLEDMKYLILTGDYDKVQKLEFDFA